MEADWRVLVSGPGGGWDVFGEVLFDNVWVPAAIFVTQYQTRHGHNAAKSVTCPIHHRRRGRETRRFTTFLVKLTKRETLRSDFIY